MCVKEVYQQRVDATGLECPMPLLRTKLALKTMNVGDMLWVSATDSGSWQDIQKYIGLTAHQLVRVYEEDGVYQFWIRKA